MKNIPLASVISRSRALGEDYVLVEKTNLVAILSILTRDQCIELIGVLGIEAPDADNKNDLAAWSNDALKEIGQKQKEFARDAGVNECDVSYLLNKDARLNGAGRKEKIVNKLIQKLEERFAVKDLKKTS